MTDVHPAVTVPTDALRKLLAIYEVCWNDISTVDIGNPGWLGMTVDDVQKICDSCEEFEPYESMIRALLADEIDPPKETTR